MIEQGAQKKSIKDQAVEKCQISREKRDCDESRQLSGDPEIQA